MNKFDKIKKKLEAFTASERKILFAYDPIHFEENPSDVAIMRYIDHGEDGADWPFVGTKIETEVLVFLKNHPPSIEVQKFLLTEFSADCFPDVEFDEKLIDDGIKAREIHCHRLSDKYNTDARIIAEFNNLRTNEDASHRCFWFWEGKHLITEEFVERNYESSAITSKLLAMEMVKRTNNQSIRMYLSLKFGF